MDPRTLQNEHQATAAQSCKLHTQPLRIISGHDPPTSPRSSGIAFVKTLKHGLLRPNARLGQRVKGKGWEWNSHRHHPLSFQMRGTLNMLQNLRPTSMSLTARVRSVLQSLITFTATGT